MSTIGRLDPYFPRDPFYEECEGVLVDQNKIGPAEVMPNLVLRASQVALPFFSGIPGLPSGLIDLRPNLQENIRAYNELKERATGVKSTLSALLPKIKAMTERINDLKVRELKFEEKTICLSKLIKSKKQVFEKYKNINASELTRNSENILNEIEEKFKGLQSIVSLRKEEIKQAIMNETRSYDYRMLIETINQKSDLLRLERELIPIDKLELALSIRFADQAGSSHIGSEKENTKSKVILNLKSAKKANDEALAAISKAENALSSLSKMIRQ